jgi:hypothetical protein
MEKRKCVALISYFISKEFTAEQNKTYNYKVSSFNDAGFGKRYFTYEIEIDNVYQNIGQILFEFVFADLALIRERRINKIFAD